MPEQSPHPPLSDPTSTSMGTAPSIGHAELERLFRSHYRRVFGFFHNRRFTSEDCHDLTQEVFLRVYKNIASFRQEAALETFLFTVTQSVWKNRIRSLSTKKRKAVDVVSIEASREHDHERYLLRASGAGQDEEVIAKEQLQHLSRAIDELPARMRQCVLLRYNQDLSEREIAQALQISKGTVKSQLSQARQRLTALIREAYGSIDDDEEEKP